MISVTIFFAFLCLCLNTAYGDNLVGTPNTCTMESGTSCDIKANDIIEFDLSCNPSFKDDYSILKIPKGSFLVSSDKKKIKIHIANIIEKDESVTYTQQCSTDSSSITRTINYKKSGKELKVPGIDFTGSSIHFKQKETSISQDKTITIDVGNWKVSTSVGIACPHKNIKDMKCFSEVINAEDRTVAIKDLIPKATFSFFKNPFVQNSITHVESLVTFTGPEIVDPNNIDKTPFEFKCICTVGTNKGTVIFKGTMDLPKKNETPGASGSNGTDPSTNPNEKDKKNNSFITSFHKIFGLLTVFLYFYLMN